MAKREIKKVSVEQTLFNELSLLIDKSQQQVIAQANSTITMLFWYIGNRINESILQNKRADYGKQIVVTLSRQLVEKYGRNFEEKNLRRMLQFAEQFTDKEIVVTLSRHLSWSHFLVLIPLKKIKAKLFYAQKVASEALGVRDLRKQIATKTFERTTIANLQSPTNNQISYNTFKDPYFLDFLGLRNDYLEKDLEVAILKDLEAFILELGNGFTFVERQKRMIIDGKDFRLDLLFYHRKLKRLIAIDLKLGEFKAGYKSQMELYLRWLEKNEMQAGEKTPIGLILCAEGNKEQIELLQLNKAGIKIAEYLTELPSKKLLQQKLHQAVEISKKQIENNK